MTRTELNKKIRSLKADLANGQFRSGVIERRLEALAREEVKLTGDRRARQQLMLANCRSHQDSLKLQLYSTYADVLRSRLELDEANYQMHLLPPEPSPPKKPLGQARVPSGLYRMGRLRHRDQS